MFHMFTNDMMTRTPFLSTRTFNNRVDTSLTSKYMFYWEGPSSDSHWSVKSLVRLLVSNNNIGYFLLNRVENTFGSVNSHVAIKELVCASNTSYEWHEIGSATLTSSRPSPDIRWISTKSASTMISIYWNDENQCERRWSFVQGLLPSWTWSLR